MLILAPLIGVRNLYSRYKEKDYPTTTWVPKPLVTEQEVKDFCSNNYKWKQDPGPYGIFDHIQPTSYGNYRLEYGDFIKGDCDDLATYTLYTLARSTLPITATYRVNIVSMKHVIGVYCYSGRYNYTTNFEACFNMSTGGVKSCVRQYCKDVNAQYTPWWYAEKLRF